MIRKYRVPTRQRSKLTVIPHGHYIDWYPNNITKSCARESLNLDEADTVFLHFGRLAPYKNLPALIETFQSVNHDRCRLLIVGKPSNDSIAEVIANASFDDNRIRFEFGYIPDAFVQRYLNAADAVVLPYRDVLSSGSAILAASFQRAIIAPRMGCIADRFGDGGGLRYDPVSETLESAMELALELDLDQMGRADFDKVSHSDWESIAAETAAVYQIDRLESRSACE